MAAGGGKGDSRGTVLVVDDEESVGRTISTYFGRSRVEQVFTLWQGFESYRAIDDLRLAFIDLNLPGGEAFDAEDPLRGGFQLAHAMRRDLPDVPLLIFSAHHSPPLVNAAVLAGAQFLVKERYSEVLSLLARRLELAESAGGWAQAEVLDWLRADCGASPRELEVARHALQGFGPADIAVRLRRGKGTIKQHVRGLLRKTGLKNLDELRERERTIRRGRGGFAGS